MMIRSIRQIALTLCIGTWTGASHGEVILQYFETEWQEIERRLPEIGEIGYGGIWHPSPAKSPVAGVYPNGGGGNVGYSLFDRFDLGDVPQRGTLRTRYGTRNELREMVDTAHQHDINIYPDIIMNHAGNGPDYRTYPGMRPNDFHGWWDAGQPGGFKRASRMSNYGEVNNGYGRTFQEELVSLIDIQTERDDRFTANAPFFSAPDSFIRHPGQPEKYVLSGGVPVAENPVEFLNRWIVWLGEAMDYDGVRLDAPKHVIADFFGTEGDLGGFNHNIQYSFDTRRGLSDPNTVDEMYQNYLARNDALIFSEMFIGSQSEVAYWQNFNGGGVKMRYLDFPRKSQMIGPAFSGGNLAALSSFAGFSPEEGVMFAHSHDEGPPSKLELAYAYILTRVGQPIVFFTGNNLDPADIGNKTWMKLGYESALGDHANNRIPNLVYIHNQFARGKEWERWSDGDVYAYERYDDGNTSNSPDANEGLLLVGLNASGSPQFRNLQTAFAPFTPLKDYGVHGGAPITVKANGSVDVTIPAGVNGQGWVCYAPYVAEADGTPVRFRESGAAAGTMDWVVPGGARAADKARTIPRVTQNTIDIDVHYTNPTDGGTVDGVMIKWGRGQDLNGGTTFFDTGRGTVSGGFQVATNVGTRHYRLTADLTNVPEGLHLVKARAFRQRPGGFPAVFQTFHTSVYVDRHGPDLETNLADGATITGDAILEINNPDRTAGTLDIRVDGGSWTPAHEIQRGLFRTTLTGLSAGSHTVELRAREFDRAASPAQINESIVSRTYTVVTPGMTLALNHGEGDTLTLPFFKTVISHGAGDLKLFWDGYEMTDLQISGTGQREHTFTGKYTQGGEDLMLWGAFVNGPHFFEARLVNGGVTQRVCRTVHFNLYGNNSIDSDGDGLPDDVEMPFFSTGSNPGPNVPWPGDTSGDGDQDMIPNYGEFWTRLNPMNADTTYNGTWDGDEDWDGDGIPNICEVQQGVLLNGNPYHYNIYDAGSKPASCDVGPIAPIHMASPNPACEADTVTISYQPNEGPLNGTSPYVGIVGEGVFPMVNSGGTWTYEHTTMIGDTEVEYWFQNMAGTAFDNNGGANWSIPVVICGAGAVFSMDGAFDTDGDGTLIVANGMKIHAAVRGQTLYVATWSANGDDNGNDHYLFITDNPNNSEAAPWNKAGVVYFDKASKPWMAAESAGSGGFHTWNNGGAQSEIAMGPNGGALEGEINLVEVFGSMPEKIYLAAAAYGDNDGEGIGGPLSQAPPAWDIDNDLQIMEFQAVHIDSIRDENADRWHDHGRPRFWSRVGDNTIDANYGLRRFFLDELAGDRYEMTFLLDPGLVATGTVHNVQLISNLNRRDFAELETNRDTISTTGPSDYWRAYPMTLNGEGLYEVTLPVTRCGAYRVSARWKTSPGGPWVQYTDNAQRRDCAVVVSPTKALETVLYEVNPNIVEATDDTFAGRSTFRDLWMANTDRPDILNTNHYAAIGANMLWLQPIHPIGIESRETDPATSNPYDPGSPYAVRDYWTVNPILGADNTAGGAMSEFVEFVEKLDEVNVGVMMDGTFNHSAPDCIVGAGGQTLFGLTPTDKIRDARIGWFAQEGNPGSPATFFNSELDTDIAVAPDRNDFGKWSDVREIYFGDYDYLVNGSGSDNRWLQRFLFEEDHFYGHNPTSREVWEYFAHYPIYWLEQTGHPAGTPKDQSHKGIDGLRCDFAQGLPSDFWEYCINRTRGVKWDFLFMAESLDGNRVVNGELRHGVGYRSARHFDILNENMVFYWRNQFFNYPYQGPGGANDGNGDGFADNPQPKTFPTWQAFDERRNAFEGAPLLLNLTSHDEVFPSDDPYSLLYAYAQLSVLDGVPMLMYGQEAGAQNNAAVQAGVGNADHNWDRYETNFGKSIPNFKRFNSMKNVWANRDFNLQGLYGKMGSARLASPALRGRNNYFLSVAGANNYEPDIFAVAKYEEAGLDAAQQDVVFAFVNNNYQGSTNRWATFALDAVADNGTNWFGILPGRTYNLRNLIGANPNADIWATDRTGADLIASGITVGLTGNPFLGEQAQYLKLVDTAVAIADNDGDGWPDATDPDDDNDGLPDWWEILHGLDPFSADGDDSPDGDPDEDGRSNWEEYLAGTDPMLADSKLHLDITQQPGDLLRLGWKSVPDRIYFLERSLSLAPGEVLWETLWYGTAEQLETWLLDNVPPSAEGWYYRVRLKP